MSFDISLQCFRENRSSKFPRSLVWDKIAPYAKDDKGWWEVCFPDRSGGSVILDNDEDIDGFSVDRPCEGMFYDTLVQIMKEVPILLTWGEGCCVADEKVIAGLPSFMIDALGVPPIVHNGSQLQRCIYEYKSDRPETFKNEW